MGEWRDPAIEVGSSNRQHVNKEPSCVSALTYFYGLEATASAGNFPYPDEGYGNGYISGDSVAANSHLFAFPLSLGAYLTYQTDEEPPGMRLISHKANGIMGIDIAKG